MNKKLLTPNEIKSKYCKKSQNEQFTDKLQDAFKDGRVKLEFAKCGAELSEIQMRHKLRTIGNLSQLEVDKLVFRTKTASDKCSVDKLNAIVYNQGGNDIRQPNEHKFDKSKEFQTNLKIIQEKLNGQPKTQLIMKLDQQQRNHITLDHFTKHLRNNLINEELINDEAVAEIFQHYSNNQNDLQYNQLNNLLAQEITEIGAREIDNAVIKSQQNKHLYENQITHNQFTPNSQFTFSKNEQLDALKQELNNQIQFKYKNLNNAYKHALNQDQKMTKLSLYKFVNQLIPNVLEADKQQLVDDILLNNNFQQKQKIPSTKQSSLKEKSCSLIKSDEIQLNNQQFIELFSKSLETDISDNPKKQQLILQNYANSIQDKNQSNNQQEQQNNVESENNNVIMADFDQEMNSQEENNQPQFHDQFNLEQKRIDNENQLKMKGQAISSQQLESLTQASLLRQKQKMSHFTIDNQMLNDSEQFSRSQSVSHLLNKKQKQKQLEMIQQYEDTQRKSVKTPSLLQLKKICLDVFENKPQKLAHSIVLCQQAAKSNYNQLHELLLNMGGNYLTNNDVNYLLQNSLDKNQKVDCRILLNKLGMDRECQEVITNLKLADQLTDLNVSNGGKMSADNIAVPLCAQFQVEKKRTKQMENKTNNSSQFQQTYSNIPPHADMANYYKYKEREAQAMSMFKKDEDAKQSHKKQFKKHSNLNLDEQNLDDVKNRPKSATLWGKYNAHSDFLKEPLQTKQTKINNYSHSTIGEFLNETKVV